MEKSKTPITEESVMKLVHALELKRCADEEELGRKCWLLDKLYECVAEWGQEHPYLRTVKDHEPPSVGDNKAWFMGMCTDVACLQYTVPTTDSALRFELLNHGVDCSRVQSVRELRRLYQDHACSTCPICIEDFKEGDNVFEIPCGHVYHTQCARMSWMKPAPESQFQICCVCRENIFESFEWRTTKLLGAIQKQEHTRNKRKRGLR